MNKYINTQPPRQFKKIAVEIGLITIKGTVLLKKLLAFPFRLIAGFFRWVFKLLFYKILVKIYYQLFRLRKLGFIKHSPLELFRRQSVYFFIFGLLVIVLTINFSATKRASAMDTKIPKTVMFQLVATDFSVTAADDLIEEIASPNSVLTAGKDKYIDDSCSLPKQTIINSTDESDQFNSFSFDENSDLVFKPELITPGSSADNGSSATARTEIVEYTVQNGDTVSSIAHRFGITINTILWANNLTAYSLIRPGDSLSILPYSGVLYVVKKGDTLARIAQLYDVELDKILSCNNLGNSIAVGEKIVVPGAQKINTAVAVKKPSASYTGISVIKDLISSPGVKASGNKMVWPTVGARITQYYGAVHTGVDIANKVGTAIYAADDGVVLISQGGYNGGYGNTIVIDHGGGVKTRYGHASKLYVKAGQTVTKGQVIAAMGSTGRSTGSHLHFEVLVNGARRNPLNYIKY
ncbi:MAG: M23 family metallopeptidase [Patescibacteria group bacterium]